MQHNPHNHQQLLQDRLFLEKIFLLDIEQADTADTIAQTPALVVVEPDSEDVDKSSNEDNLQNVSAPTQTRNIAPLSFVSIYAIVVTLLLLFPSNRHSASSQTIAIESDNERLLLLETKPQQLEAKTKILTSSVALNSQQQPLPVVETTAPKILPPAQTAANSQAVNTKKSTELNVDRLPLLPVPAPPPIAAPTSLSIPSPAKVDTVAKKLRVGVEREIPLKVAVASTEPETKSNEVQKPAEQWLGQANVVYYSHSFERTEPEETANKNEDLQQYLTSVPSSKNKAVDSKHRLEPDNSFSEDEDLAQYLDSTPLLKHQSESSDSTSNSVEPQKRSLFDDEDLARYLDSELLDDEVVGQILDTNPIAKATEQSEKNLFPSGPEKMPLDVAANGNSASRERQNSAIEVNYKSLARQPLFADEDLKQFLTATPLLTSKL